MSKTVIKTYPDYDKIEFVKRLVVGFGVKVATVELDEKMAIVVVRWAINIQPAAVSKYAHTLEVMAVKAHFSTAEPEGFLLGERMMNRTAYSPGEIPDRYALELIRDGVQFAKSELERRFGPGNDA